MNADGDHMTRASIQEFRETRRVTKDASAAGCEDIFSYWNNHSVTAESCDREEVLHIARRADGSFYLEIGNIVHSGTLDDLEKILYEWARDEGWLD
jgi:hypothetical protein